VQQQNTKTSETTSVTYDVFFDDFPEPGVGRVQVSLQLCGSPRKTLPAGVPGNFGNSFRYFGFGPFGSNEGEVLFVLQANLVRFWDLQRMI
jgi:hypothetical protein